MVPIAKKATKTIMPYVNRTNDRGRLASRCEGEPLSGRSAVPVECSQTSSHQGNESGHITRTFFPQPFWKYYGCWLFLSGTPLTIVYPLDSITWIFAYREIS